MQKENNKPATKASDIIPDQFQVLFCEPTLLGGEDPSLFWDLVAAVIAERKPETASDWVAVSDLVTKLWEERLLKRASNALVRGGMMQTLGSCLEKEEKKPEKSGYTLEELTKLQVQWAATATRWLEGRSDKWKANELGSLLARFGTTESELYANAFVSKSETLLTFERMIAARERGRRKLRKEDERRRREQMKRSKPNGSASQWPVKNSSGPTAKTPSKAQGQKQQQDA